MREIKEPKFRGFSLETNSWHYGHGWFKCDYTEKYMAEKGMNDRAILLTDSYPVECELASMGQYTGLEDKNGKEIFEGDILGICNEDPLFVEYIEKHGAFCFVDIFDKFGPTNYTAKEFSYEAFEVIGNIYENPELLI